MEYLATERKRLIYREARGITYDWNWAIYAPMDLFTHKTQHLLFENTEGANNPCK